MREGDPLVLRWCGATLAAAVLLASCAPFGGTPSSSGRPPDIINPAQAREIASTFAAQRIRALERYDTSFISQNEADPIMTADLALARAVLQGTQHLVATTVSAVDVYVSHQTSYPARFLGIVRSTDGLTSLMGFQVPSKGKGRLVTVAVMGSSLELGLAKLSDGFAPQPSEYFTLEPSRLDPSKVLAWSLNHTCASTPGCRLDTEVTAPGIGGDPKGYTPDLISAAFASTRMADFISTGGTYAHLGLVFRYAAAPRDDPDFPWYHLNSGGTLRFVDLSEETDVTASHGCFAVTVLGGAIDPALPAGTYHKVEALGGLLVAVEVPKSQTSGQITEVAISGYIAANNTQTC